MSDKNNDTDFRLSRRKILGAAGTVGAAGALGGAATTSLLWDEEKFGNITNPNVLQAGELDLKVDWEEHYSDWSGDESKELGNDVVMTEMDPNEVPAGYIGLPDPTEPLLAVHQGDLAQFMNKTAIEAYPDPNNNGVQDDFDSDEVGNFCSDGADLPEDLDPNGLRSDNSDTRGKNGPAPLVSLMDVKPGDFGELTLSLHLCDNPGYVWLQGDLVEARENGVTEPEEAAPDETGPEDEVSTNPETADVELLDAVETTWWYDDNCNNVLEPGDTTAKPVCVELVLDASGSMSGDKNKETIKGAKSLAEKVLNANPDNRIGVTFFSAKDYHRGAENQLSVDSTNDDDKDGTVDPKDVDTVKDVIDSLPANGRSTAIGAGINTGQKDLQDCPSGMDRVMVVLSNGGERANSNPRQEAADACEAGTRIFTIAIGSQNQTLMEDIACHPGDAYAGAGASAIEQIFEDITRVITGGEDIFFRGTLREALIELSSGFGIPLDGDRNTQFNETEDDSSSDKRECYEALEPDCIGVAWYLPRDLPGMVDNAIQTDAVAFNLGFYTEQCRHNDGSGTTDDVGNA